MDLYAQNETFSSPECVGPQADALQNGAGNGSLETSNITCSNVSTLLTPQREWTNTQHFVIWWLIIKCYSNTVTVYTIYCCALLTCLTCLHVVIKGRQKNNCSFH